MAEIGEKKGKMRRVAIAGEGHQFLPLWWAIKKQETNREREGEREKEYHM